MRLFPYIFVGVCASAFSVALEKPQEQQLQFIDTPFQTTDSWEYRNCGLESDPIQIESIEVSPDPPQVGQELTVKVSGEVKEVIEEGAYADVTVKLGLVKLLQKRFDVCEEARNANASVQCPVQPGPYVVEQTVTLPKEIPKAKFVVAVSGYTVDNEDMLCIQLKVDFMKRPFPKFW